MLPDEMRKLAEQLRHLHATREQAKETKIAHMLRAAATLAHMKRKVRPTT